MTVTSSESQEKTAAVELPKSLFNRTVLFFWHFHRKLIISLIVLLALVLVILRSLALYLESNPHIIENLVESQLQRQVTFTKLKVNVSPFFPSVSMKNFAIKNEIGKEKLLEFASASIKLNILRSVFHGQVIIETLALEGISALVQRNSHGEISIAERQLTNAQQDVARPGTKQSFLLLLEQINLVITDSEVMFIDEMQEYPTVFLTDINLNMKNRNEKHQVALLAKLNNTDVNLDLRLDFRGKIDDIKNWDGKVYGAVDNMNHQSILNFIEQDVLQIENFQINDVTASTKVWSEIKSGRLKSIHGELSVTDAKLKRIDREQAIRFDRMATNFKLERFNLLTSDSTQEETHWLIDLYDLNVSINSKPRTQKHINLNYKKNKNNQLAEIQVFLNVLDLKEFSDVVSFFSPKDFNKQIYRILKPRGQLKNIISTVKFKSLDMPIDIINYQVQADIKGFGVNSFQSLPKIRNFSAQLLFNETMGRVTIDSHDMELHVKSLFRDTWPVTQLNGEVYWQKEGADWLFGGEKLSVTNPHLKANADLKLWFLEDGQTLMDLTGFYHDANVQFVSYYLPVAIMSDNLVKWLDESIISGWGTDGGVVYRGNLSQFPYKDHSGAMDIVFNTRDVMLEYQKGWPKATDIKALVQFTEQGMWIESSHSKVFSALSVNIQVNIERYLQPVLRIKGDVKSSIDDSVQFLTQSELASQEVLAILDAKDDIAINLDLSIPLNEGEADSKIKISLNNADYYPPGFERKAGFISKLKGDVMVHNQSINAKSLTAEIMGHPAKIAIKTAKKSSGSKQDPVMSLAINSGISVKNLAKFDLLPEGLNFLQEQISGDSRIHLAIDLPNQQRPLAFNISSDLKGIKSQLPPPFAKQAKDSSPFKLSYAEIRRSTSAKKVAQDTGQKARVNMNYSDLVSLAILLDTSREEIELIKGNLALEGWRAELPKQNKLTISGSLTKAPLDQWQAVLSSQSGKKNQTSSSKPFIPIELSMTELVLPKLDLASDSDKKTNVSTTVTFKPDQFPLLNGSIDAIKLGTVNLGKFTIQSSRVKRGIVFESLGLKGKLLSFAGNGKWHHNRKQKSRVELQGDIKIPSMGQFFLELGYEQLMRGGACEASGAINWPGGPGDFSTKIIDGNLAVTVNKGAYLEGKPGAAGRLLGLLNMNALARRISLDFSDVSRKGYEFDKIKGDFRFTNGNAYTDNLRVFASSADVLVTGRIGMASEDIDQHVTVIPEVSATLPIAGAAVAGPAGAAVVWVGQKLLGEQLNKVTAYAYTVKGNWQDPVIKRDSANQDTEKNVKKLLELEKNDTNPVFNNNGPDSP